MTGQSKVLQPNGIKLLITMTIFSLFILLIGIPIVLYLIASIFIGNLKNKLFNFEMVLLYVTISGIIIILILMFVGLNILFPSLVHVNNIVAVIIVVSTFGIFIYAFPRIQKRYYNRFDKLYVPEIKREDIRDKFIKFVLKRTLYYSSIISLFITILTGLWEKSELSVPEKTIYGYPLPWLTQYSDKIPSLEINYQSLFGNWFLYGLIIFVVLIFIQYIFRKKLFNRFIKKTIIIKKGTWENDPRFIKYDKNNK